MNVNTKMNITFALRMLLIISFGIIGLYLIYIGYELEGTITIIQGMIWSYFIYYIGRAWELDVI